MSAGGRGGREQSCHQGCDRRWWRDADLLLTIDPLGPGAPGGPIMPRSPCDGDNKSGRSQLWVALWGAGAEGLPEAKPCPRSIESPCPAHGHIPQRVLTGEGWGSGISHSRSADPWQVQGGLRSTAACHTVASLRPGPSPSRTGQWHVPFGLGPRHVVLIRPGIP